MAPLWPCWAVGSDNACVRITGKSVVDVALWGERLLWAWFVWYYIIVFAWSRMKILEETMRTCELRTVPVDSTGGAAFCWQASGLQPVRPLLVRGNGLGTWMARHVARCNRAPAKPGGRNDRRSVGSAGGGGDDEVQGGVAPPRHLALRAGHVARNSQLDVARR
eukprot:s1168_g3.t1